MRQLISITTAGVLLASTLGYNSAIAFQDNQLLQYRWANTGQEAVIARFQANPRELPGGPEESISFNYSQQFDHLNLGLASARSEYDQRYNLGFGFQHVGLNFFSGQGEGYLRTENPLASIDPYYFHGGNLQPFKYNGAALSIATTPSSILMHVPWAF